MPSLTHSFFPIPIYTSPKYINVPKNTQECRIKKGGGLPLNRDPLAANNGLFGGVRLDIPALAEFPLYPVPLLVPDLNCLRVIFWTAILADLLIRGDVVDRYRWIHPVLFHARRTGPALGTFGFVARRTEGVALIGFHRVKIRLKILIVLMRVPRGSGRPSAPIAHGPALDECLSLPDILRIPPPPLHLGGVRIDDMVKFRYSEPFLNFMIVYFLQPLLCDGYVCRLFLNADVIPA